MRRKNPGIGKTCKSRAGFTLLETLVVIVVLSIASLAIVAPRLMAARGAGSHSASILAQTTGLLQEQAEIITADLDGLSQEEWVSTLSNLSSSSPVLADQPVVIDSVSCDITMEYSCVRSDLSTPDPACSDGYAFVTISIQPKGYSVFSLSLVKTIKGL